MILFDFSHIVIEACTHSVNKFRQIHPAVVKENVFLRMGKIIGKHKREYGMPVICRDGRGYWRRQVFPYYKAKRAEERQAQSNSVFDWDVVFSLNDQIAKDFEHHFGYLVLERNLVEADDTIASIVRQFPLGKHLIIGADHDFQQLKVFGNVDQMKISGDPVEIKGSINEAMLTHVIKGDGGDGVPNILSGDDWLYLKIRQKPISQKMLDSVAHVDMVNGAGAKDLADAVYAAQPWQNAIKNLGLDKAVIEERIARNMNLVLLTKPHHMIDGPTYNSVSSFEVQPIDYKHVMGFLANEKLNEVASNIGQFEIS